MVSYSVSRKRKRRKMESSFLNLSSQSRKHFSTHLKNYLFYSVGNKKYSEEFLKCIPFEDLFTLYENEGGTTLDKSRWDCFEFWRFVRSANDPSFNSLPLTEQIIDWKISRNEWLRKEKENQEPPRELDPAAIGKWIEDTKTSGRFEWVSIAPKEKEKREALDIEVVLEEKSESKVLESDLERWNRENYFSDSEEEAPEGGGHRNFDIEEIERFKRRNKRREERKKKEELHNPYPWMRVGDQEEAQARYEKFIALSDEEKRRFLRHYNRENGLPEGSLQALRLIYPFSKKIEEKDLEFAKENSFLEKDSEDSYNRIWKE